MPGGLWINLGPLLWHFCWVAVPSALCVTTPPHPPAWYLLRLRPLLRTPERGLGVLEARGGLRSSLQARPKVEDVALSTTRHFADNPHEVSVDLTWDEVRPLILDWGFVLEREEWRRCTYTRNPASLYQMEYECIFFVARWPGGATAPGSTPPPPPPPPPPPSDEPAPPPPPAAS